MAMNPYLPLEHFQTSDDDYSSTRIRDMPYGKRREALALRPLDLIFNNTVIDRVSTPEILILSNVGYDSVSIQDIQVVGDFIYNGPFIKSIDAGEIVDLYVSFKPILTGRTVGGLYITAPNAIGTKFVSLDGTGVLSEDYLMQYPLIKNAKATSAAINIPNAVYGCVASGVFDGAVAQLEWRPDAATAWVTIGSVKFTAANTIYGIPLNIGQARIVITNPGFSTSLTVTLMW